MLRRFRIDEASEEIPLKTFRERLYEEGIKPDKILSTKADVLKRRGKRIELKLHDYGYFSGSGLCSQETMMVLEFGNTGVRVTHDIGSDPVSVAEEFEANARDYRKYLSNIFGVPEVQVQYKLKEGGRTTHMPHSISSGALGICFYSPPALKATAKPEAAKEVADPTPEELPSVRPVQDESAENPWGIDLERAYKAIEIAEDLLGLTYVRLSTMGFFKRCEKSRKGWYKGRSVLQTAKDYAKENGINSGESVISFKKFSDAMNFGGAKMRHVCHYFKNRNIPYFPAAREDDAVGYADYRFSGAKREKIAGEIKISSMPL